MGYKDFPKPYTSQRPAAWGTDLSGPELQRLDLTYAKLVQQGFDVDKVKLDVGKTHSRNSFCVGGISRVSQISFLSETLAISI